MLSLRTLVATAALMLAGPATAGAAIYDPLRLPAVEAPAPVDLEVHDKDRDRDIPLRVYLPALGGPAPVVLFSHGLGGSREGSSFLGRHWAARGYVAVFLQHPGSDSSVWAGTGREQGMRELRKAANVKNFKLRAEDVAEVLDQLERWNDRPGSVLHGRMDLSRIGMSGHSFGAITSQAVSGQSYASGGQRFTDKRIDAAILFSPSSPQRGTPGRAFADVKLPWLLMTGTEDQAPIGDAVEGRLAVYPALPPGGKYELVLDGAKHSAFTDRPLPNDKGERNPNHHRAILAISTAFWDACLKGDAQARAWLDGEAVRQVLEPADRWQHK
jgi:predicted dienelactone hydrolase